MRAMGFPPLHSTIGALISCLELFESVSKSRRDCDRLAEDLEDQIIQLNRYLNSSGFTSLTDCVNNVIKSLRVEVERVEEERKQGALKNVLRANDKEEELAHNPAYFPIHIYIALRVDASLSTWSIANKILANNRLEALLPSKLARYNAALPADIVRRTCTEHTRTDILSELDDWSRNATKPKLYWMNGMAGTGKTTIACSLAAALTKCKQLGASFFCTRTLPECRDVSRIVPTIAYQLARYSRPFQAELCKVLANDPDIRTQQIRAQFEHMLKEPLIKVKAAIPDNVVVVIDALDECDGASEVELLLTEVFRSALDLPLKFFVTSRPEPGISDSFMAQGSQARDILHLHEIDKSLVQADIYLYLKEELSSISLSEMEIEKLSELAGNLFIYAATAIRYIRPARSGRIVNSKKRVQDILLRSSSSTKQHAELDALYMTVLQGALGEDLLEPQEARDWMLVLWTAVLVREPVSVECLAALTGLDTNNAHTILQSLYSVIHISQGDGLVSMLHASFTDFIGTKDRSQRFHCHAIHTQFIAKQCFSLTKGGLRFNICVLESSFLLDESIYDLDQRVNMHISRELLYACCYWVDHLLLADSPDDLTPILEGFLTHRFLFWMEVLNLTGSGALVIAALYHVQQWLIFQVASPYLIQLLCDARLFIANFSQNPSASSTPHIYVSALPFCHRSSLVYSPYQGRMRGLINIGGTALEKRLGNDAKWSTGVKIEAISASPTGNLVAFGGRDHENHGMVGVLDYHTGAYSLPSFKGHKKPVTSVAFSPDGSCLASASNDHTISVWNTSNAKRSCEPCIGHTDVVNSVVFSPNGMLLVSGSDDRTIRAWTSRDGKPAMKPLEGHAAIVSCVSVSPDGTHIVSGSNDKTIRVWSVHDGTLCFGPFRVDDTYQIRSVAFLASGLYVAVGFNAGLYMWDLQKGEQVSGFAQGHTDRTISIALSPDRTRVITSCDSSGIICTWNAQTGKLVSQVNAHTEDVNCVVFSSDGAYMLSGSGDTTICVWPVLGSNNNTDTPQDVPSPVSCIAFSVDGDRFASGCDDGSVCVWSLRDGSRTFGPLTGHGASVAKVAFSPDQSYTVSVARDGSLFTRTTQTGSIANGPVQGPVTGVTSTAISPDTASVVSGFNSGGICIWGVADGKLIVDSFEGHSERVHSLAFSSGGTRVISGSWDNAVCVWNAHNGTHIIKPFTAHTSLVTTVAFPPNSNHVASGSADHTIYVRNAENGLLVAGPLVGHNHWVVSVAFSPDGNLIVSASRDGDVRIWDVRTGEQVAGPFTGPRDSIGAVAFSPDGHHIVCCRNDHSIRFIPVFPPPPGASVLALGGELTVDSSGWLVNRQRQYLHWLPPHIRSFFQSQHESLVIFPNGTMSA